METLILYSYFRSSASHRVRIALNLKGLSYEYRAVHLLENGGEQNKEEFKKLNPLGQVPALIHKGRALGQSMAIIDYLEAIQPEPALFPSDSYEKARCLQACEIINSGIQPLANLGVLQELEKKGFDSAMKNAWAQQWIQKGMQALEAILVPTAGAFCFGDQVSAADCFLVPQVFAAKRFGVEIESYPLLAKIHTRCMEMREFIRAAPDAQPDTPRT